MNNKHLLYVTQDITILKRDIDIPTTTEVLYDDHSDISGIRYTQASQEPCNLEGTGSIQALFSF